MITKNDARFSIDLNKKKFKFLVDHFNLCYKKYCFN